MNLTKSDISVCPLFQLAKRLTVLIPAYFSAQIVVILEVCEDSNSQVYFILAYFRLYFVLMGQLLDLEQTAEFSIVVLSFFLFLFSRFVFANNSKHFIIVTLCRVRLSYIILIHSSYINLVQVVQIGLCV
jgi:hypothetical protein